MECASLCVKIGVSDLLTTDRSLFRFSKPRTDSIFSVRRRKIITFSNCTESCIKCTAGIGTINGDIEVSTSDVTLSTTPTNKMVNSD